MPRRVFPASTVTNTTGAALPLTFYATSTTNRREADLWTVDGSNNLVERIPNGVILADAVTGAYSAFAGPDDLDTLYALPNNTSSRTTLTASAGVVVPGDNGTPTWATPAASTTLTGTLSAWTVTAVDCTAGAGARTLPAASSVAAGTPACAKKGDTSSNNLVVSRAGSDLIYGTGTGATSKTLSLAGEAVEFVSNGVDKWTIRASDTPSGVLNTTYARSGSATFRAGRLWMFAGDSITNGSAASNSVYSYPRQACHMVGTVYASSDSIEAGTAGYTSTQLLAFMPTLLSTYSPEAVHIQIGTNDSGNSVPLATFQANIRALVALVKATGKPVTIGTIPPRGSGATTAQRQFIGAYNLWLRLWAPGAGVELADVHAALVDTTSGDYLSTYNSGDDVHPNDAGHREIARVVAAAMIRAMPTTRASLVNAFSTSVSLIANPLMVTAGTDPTGSISGVATGTAPTRSIVTDTSGVLPAGKWAQVDLDAGATSAFGRDLTINAALWSVGDVLALTGLIQVEDVTGSGAWDTAVAAGTASASVTVINATGGLNLRSWGDRCAGRALSAGIYNLGPFFTTYTIAAGITGMTYRYQVNAPNGLHVKARFGCLNVFNLTTLGVAGGTAAMIAVDGP